MKERYQDIDDKNEALRGYLEEAKEHAKDFLARFEMSWLYHDHALEGIIYTPQELQAALGPSGTAQEASLLPVVYQIRNHQAACNFVRKEAEATAKKPVEITVATLKQIHDILSGNTPEAEQLRQHYGLREKTAKEKEREKEKAGFRKDMPLHRTYFHEIAQPSKIQGLLEKLAEYTTTAEFREFHPIKQAAHVQHQLMHIFPFTEYSGNVARMSSNLILIRNRYLPAIIHSIDRQRYYEALRGNTTVFRGLLMDAMENSLDNALKYFRDMARRYKAIN